DSDATAVIHYTVDGSTPTAHSTTYGGTPISVSSSETVKALAVSALGTPSPVVSFAYVIAPPPPAPTVSPAPGIYTSTQSVSLLDAEVGTTIHFTLDGSIPTTSSATYSGPIPVGSSGTIRAIAVSALGTPSAAASFPFVIIPPPPPAPTANPAPGLYTSTQSVTLGDSDTSALIYYTLDGSTPSAASTPYSAPIPVGTSGTIKAIAVSTSGISSATAALNFVIAPPPAAPVATPAAGTYTSAQSVTLSDADSGTTIHYTVDGSTPTANSATYLTPIAVGSSETVKAVAVSGLGTPSPAASFAYVINLPPP